MTERRELVRQLLVQLALAQKVELASYSILPDHLHFISSAGTRGLVGFVRDFKSASARQLRRRGLRGSLWQRSFFDHKLRNDQSLSEKSQYIWLNPVRRGLVREAKDYPWSGGLREGQHHAIGRPDGQV